MDDKNLEQSLRDSALLFIEELKRTLVSKGKSSSGELINSIDFKIVQTAQGITAEIVANSYLTQVDQGRKPGRMPPVSSLIPWVKKKGMVGRGRSAEDVAWAVAWSIGKKGTKATNVVEETKARLLDNIQNIIADAAIQDLGDQADAALKELK